ncbi:MAG: Gfo/Idh/MocA family oxidoreductase [Bacteroidales bacterium]|nr:Gfo/Idh/MocA family oxidoreductase [Bacteroidales bacterium]
MKINAIIGAGQLGSRHLQGLLKYGSMQTIYVLDPSEESLKISKSRAEEIPNEHIVHYVMEWKRLPKYLDLVIIATNSDVREDVVAKLINSHSIKFLILEKVLFQEINSYDRIRKLLELNNIKAWVNHPRRMYSFYENIKEILNNGSAKSYQVAGSNWGLGCNGLHFIDLFTYLSGASVKDIDANWIDQDILKSKREGFVEFTGTVKGMLNDQSVFQISSFMGDLRPTTISIIDPEYRIVVQEAGFSGVIRMSHDSNFVPDTYEINMENQSSLTTVLADDLFNSGNCMLPFYPESFETHKKFVEALLNKYNKLSDKSNIKLPIT